MAAKACSVLITGANRGLGLEMVEQMVESPWPVHQLLACCRDLDGLRAEKHPNVITIICLDPCSIKESAKQGKAGLNLTQDMQAAFNTNIMGPMDVTKVRAEKFLPYLQAAATASGKPGMSCSKAAVEMYCFFPMASSNTTTATEADHVCVYYDHQGAINAPESVGLLRAMDSLTEKQTEAFLDYEGKVMPW
uniref:Uncharacterized protein n=1 Tax=Hucho hucho TaxID=62062 RepID=A0A4W5QV13_9TELE